MGGGASCFCACCPNIGSELRLNHNSWGCGCGANRDCCTAIRRGLPKGLTTDAGSMPPLITGWLSLRAATCVRGVFARNAVVHVVAPFGAQNGVCVCAAYVVNDSIANEKCVLDYNVGWLYRLYESSSRRRADRQQKSVSGSKRSLMETTLQICWQQRWECCYACAVRACPLAHRFGGPLCGQPPVHHRAGGGCRVEFLYIRITHKPDSYCSGHRPLH